MALDPKRSGAALASVRLGPRAGSIAAIASDPRGALLAELDRPDAGRIDRPNLLPSGEAARAAFEYQPAQRATRQARARRAQAKAQSCRRPMRAGDEADGRSEDAAAQRRGAIPARPAAADFSRRGQGAHRAALAAEIGFVERLVWFWSNHFCVSADKVPTAMAGALRARGDPPACARPLRRHAARGRRPSGDAALSRQCALDRPELGRRRQPQQRASTRIWRARSWSCIRSACAAATPRTTSPVSPR